MKQLDKKVIAITGGSSGIGKALAELYLEKGWFVGIMSRTKIDVKSFNARVENLFEFRGDVGIEKDCEEFVIGIISNFGKLDIFINNAGVSMRSMFMDSNNKVLRRLFDTNFWGVVYCSRYSIPHLLETNGSLVTVSSISGYRGLPGRSGYSSSKFAVNGLIETIRTEFLKTKLHVMLVSPGFANTNIRNVALNGNGELQRESPLDEKKLMTPEKVALRIYNGIRRKKKIMKLTHLGWWTAFLAKWFPFFMDRMVYKHFQKEVNSPLK